MKKKTDTNKPTKYICSWSGGKDSTATVILCRERGIPLDLILFSEVMYDAKRGISGEPPEQLKWMKEYAIPLFQSWGYPVEIVHADHCKRKDYLDWFYHEHSSKATHPGHLIGFAMQGKCMINSRLKVLGFKNRIKQLQQEYTLIQYLGIAVDEPERLARLTDGKISLLAQYGIREEDTYEMCEKYGLLSPLYQYGTRGGCWFCPNSTISRFAAFAKAEPEIWKEFVNLGNTKNLVSNRFRADGKTIFDIDALVQRYIQNEREQLTFDFYSKEKNE